MSFRAAPPPATIEPVDYVYKLVHGQLVRVKIYKTGVSAKLPTDTDIIERYSWGYGPSPVRRTPAYISTSE